MKVKKGSTLVITLMVMLILVILGTAVLTVALADTKRVVHQENRTKAHYTAYSGANSMAGYLAVNPTEADDIISKTSTNPATGEINGKSFEVKVMNGGVDEIIIEGKAYYEAGSPVTVSLTMELRNHTIFDNAIFADESLDVGGNTTIAGDLGTNDSNIVFGRNFTGNITLGPDTTEATIEGLRNAGYLVNKLPAAVTFPDIDVSKYSTAPIYTQGTDVTLSNGEVRYMKTTDLTKGMNVKGNGQLHLLVTGSFELKGNDAITTPENQAKVYIYYMGTSISFKGTPSFHGVIYAPNADMECKGAGNGDFLGCIICKNYNGPQSAASSIKEDPDLKVKDLTLKGARVYKRVKWSN